MPADNLHVPVPPSMVLMHGEDGTGHCSDLGFCTFNRWLLDKAGNTPLTGLLDSSEWANTPTLGKGPQFQVC